MYYKTVHNTKYLKKEKLKHHTRTIIWIETYIEDVYYQMEVTIILIQVYRNLTWILQEQN